MLIPVMIYTVKRQATLRSKGVHGVSRRRRILGFNLYATQVFTQSAIGSGLVLQP